MFPGLDLCNVFVVRYLTLFCRYIVDMSCRHIFTLVGVFDQLYVVIYIMTLECLLKAKKKIREPIKGFWSRKYSLKFIVKRHVTDVLRMYYIELFSHFQGSCQVPEVPTERSRDSQVDLWID